MKPEKININHKKILYEKLKNVKVSISEYSFANIYLFAKTHNYHILSNNEIFITGITYDKYNFLMPTFDIRNYDINALKTMLNGYDFLFPIPEEWLDYFNNNEFSYTCKDADSDYIYTVDKLSTYKGKKLQPKRNLLYQFQKLYEYQSYPLRPDREDDALYILNEWQKSMPIGKSKTDYYQAHKAIKLIDTLGLCGGIYYADNEPAGYLLGEELNDNLFVIHFAKANTKFKGIYQFIFNQCAKNVPGDYKYFNFEQDLGKESLRIAKSSYVPEYKLKKYRVSLKK